MPVDLLISPLGDLVFSANRDAAIVSKADLTTQRIMLRLKLPRGSFVYGPKDLGSEMARLLRAGTTAEQRARGVSIVTQALKPMQDFTITSVSVEPSPTDPRGVIVYIEGKIILTAKSGARPIPFSTELPIPLAPGETLGRL